jgi:hypothetical protein
MRCEQEPRTIVCTNDFCGLAGFRVVVRQKPASGTFGTDSAGIPYFEFAYRSGSERGRTIFHFRRRADWILPDRMGESYMDLGVLTLK